MTDRPAAYLNPLQVSAPDLVNWIERKSPQAIDSWRDIGREEYGRTFTAARTAGYDVIDDLYYALVDTLDRQGTEADFAAMVTPTLRAKGWLGGDDRAIARRVLLIYTMNLRFARAAGTWDKVQRNKSVFPYIRGVTAGDERVRRPPKSPKHDHRAWDGILLPADHPFWRTYWYPLDFACRCNVIQMSRSQLARYPGTITTEAELAERVRRLGPPVFAAPGAGLDKQLAGMVERTNAQRMPDMPPIDPNLERGRGAAVWDAVMARMATDGLEALIAGVFGKAA